LSDNAWQTDLPVTVIGPLLPGSSENFIVSVTIPADAVWYQTDTVNVIAHSQNNPSQTSNTARLTTQAYAPPQISLSSTSLSSTQYPNQATTQTLLLSNGKGVPLTFDISMPPSNWISVDPITGTVPTDSSIPVQVTFDSDGMQPGVYTTTLSLASNDPINPLVSIPVRMEVIEAPYHFYVPLLVR
jgi:hypothetical protein